MFFIGWATERDDDVKIRGVEHDGPAPYVNSIRPAWFSARERDTKFVFLWCKVILGKTAKWQNEWAQDIRKQIAWIYQN